MNEQKKKNFIQEHKKTIEWCDQTFPDIKLQELYDAWVLANPELVEIVKV